MVRQDSRSLPVLLHAVGIAIGLLLGWLVMSAISPELPADEVDPGVASPTTPEQTRGDDSDSLLRPENLGPALAQLEEQLPAGEAITEIRITPGSVDAETSAGPDTVSIDEISAEIPARMVARIARERPGVSLADISYVELDVLGLGPQWLVQFDSATTDVPPPWTYSAPLAGEPVTAGIAPDDPVGER